MISSINNLINSFLAHRLTSQVKELYSSVTIFNFAVSAVAIFEPVFIYLIFIKKYALGPALQAVLLFYLAIYIVYFFIIPFGAKFAKKFGYEYSIALGTCFAVLFYLSLFGINYYFWLIFAAILMSAWSRTFYWPAYHSNFARFSSDGEQGRQISNLYIIQSAVFIVGPLMGGFILEFFGFRFLFLLVAILALISNIPMLITKEQFTPSPFKYFDAYRRLFARENRRRLFGFIGFGEELIALVIWPIFIYIIVKDFLSLGFLVAISVAFSNIIFLYIGRAADRKDSRLVLRYGAIFYFFSWLFRLLARNVLGVFLVDTYARITRQSTMIPMAATIYRRARTGSVMNTIVFFEMALILGKILAIVLAIGLLQIFTPGWNAIFIFAGLMTLLYLLID